MSQLETPAWQAAAAAAQAAEQRYRETGQLVEIESAIEAWGSIIAHPDFPNNVKGNAAAILNNSAMLLHERFTLLGTFDDLEQARALTVLALATNPSRSHDRAMLHNSLCAYLTSRYAVLADANDLEQALESAHRALELLEGDAPDRPAVLNNQVAALYEGYLRTGNLDLLNDAVQACNNMIALTHDDAPNRAGRLNTYGVLLQELFHREGDIGELRRAVYAYTTSIQLTTEQAPTYVGWLINLGSGLLDLFRVTADEEMLTQAITVLRSAASKINEGAPNRAGVLNNLGNALVAQFRREKSGDVLNEAVAAFREAVVLTTQPAHYRAAYLSGLGSTLSEMYELDADAQMLNEAVAACHESVQLTASDSARLASRLNNFAYALKNRHIKTGQREDLIEGRAAYRKACQLGEVLQTELVLTGSYNWGMWALSRASGSSDDAGWDEAIEAFAFGLRAVDSLVDTQLLRDGKESWLREAQRLPALAAFALARKGRIEEAIEALEHGRARLLVESLERDRADIEMLPQLGYGQIYSQYRRALDRMTAIEQGVVTRQDDATITDADRGMHEAREQLRMAIANIRGIAGYEDFGQRAQYAQIVRALCQDDSTKAGVYLAVTPLGSYALIVSMGKKPLVVWLNFDEDDLDRLLMGTAEAPLDSYLAGQLDFAPVTDILPRALQQLGGWMQPLFETLLAIQPRPTVLRVIATGRLGVLPVHASLCLSNVNSELWPVTDLFAFAYQASARTLRRAQSQYVQADQPMSWLGIGNPQPSAHGLAELVSAEPEVTWIAQKVKMSGGQASLLLGDQATHDAVLARIGSATHVHFACHAQFDPTNSLHSSIFLADSSAIQLIELTNYRDRLRIRLVVLSACQSGITNFTKLPEEFVGLPMGFMQIGVPGVIGTLWSVNDFSAALIMLKFYDLLLSDSCKDDPAIALSEALRWIKRATNAELYDWVVRQSVAPGVSSNVGDDAALTIQRRLRTMMLSDPDAAPYSDPYFWAAFTFFGL